MLLPTLALGATALVSGAAVASVLNRDRRVEASLRCDSSLPSPSSSSLEKVIPETTPQISWGRREIPELLREQVTRNLSFLGEESFIRFSSSFVVVVGLGSVGSHAAHMLVRSGSRRVRVIDGGKVTNRSLSSSALATMKDVGLPKTELFRKHLLRTNPSLSFASFVVDTWPPTSSLPPSSPSSTDPIFSFLESNQGLVEAIQETLTSENVESLLSSHPDYILDCTRDLETKLAIVRHLKRLKEEGGRGGGRRSEENGNKHKLPKLISVMDFTSRSDSSGIRILSIDEPTVIKSDVLAREFKRRLVEEGLTDMLSHILVAVFKAPSTNSTPPGPDAPLLPGVSGMVGNAVCSFAIMELAGKKLEVVEVTRRSIKYYKEVLRSLLKFEKQYHDSEEETPMDQRVSLEDVEYITEVVWGGASALSQSKDQNLVLVRWQKNRKPALNNLVLLTESEAQQHYSHFSPSPLPSSSSSSSSPFSPSFISFVNKKLETVPSRRPEGFRSSAKQNPSVTPPKPRSKIKQLHPNRPYNPNNNLRYNKHLLKSETQLPSSSSPSSPSSPSPSASSPSSSS